MLQVEIDAREALKGFTELQRTMPAAANKAVQIVAQSSAKAAREHVGSIFDTSGGRFLAGGIKATKQSDGWLIAPAGRAKHSGILPEHEDPTMIQARGDVKRLQTGGELAIPVSQKRSGRGKVRRTPAQMLAPGGKGFVSHSGRAIVERVGKGKRARYRVAFALTDTARTPGDLEIVDTIVKRIDERWASAIEQGLADAIQKAGMK